MVVLVLLGRLTSGLGTGASGALSAGVDHAVGGARGRLLEALLVNVSIETRHLLLVGEEGRLIFIRNKADVGVPGLLLVFVVLGEFRLLL